jgi:VCBS repeat-containing protein
VTSPIGLTTGGYSFTATDTDTYGNIGPASTALTFSDSQVKPPAPVIGTTAPAQDPATSIVISGTAEANTTVTLYNGAAVVTSATVDGNGNWSTAAIPLTNGANYNFTAIDTDTYGNVSTASNALTFQDVQSTQPTVTVSINSSDVNVAHNTATVTFNFSAVPTTFTLADTSAVGGTLSNLKKVSGTQYTATFTAATNTSTSAASIAVIANSWSITGGAKGAGGSTTFTVDTITPTVSVSINSSDVNVAHNTATMTFNFSEAPSTFTLADTTAVGGTLSSLQQVTATQYTAIFTAAANTSNSAASVGVISGSWQENNGNAGTGASTTFVVDTITPTVAVSINSSDVNLAHNTATVTFTFSEAPTSFALSDTSVVGGSLSNLKKVSATQYTATFTAAANTSNTAASVGVVAGSWLENNGNAGSASSTTFTVDTVTPTVAVTSNNTDVNLAHGTATVTFTFSETPTSFSLADTSAVGGTLSNLQQVSATQYTATFTGAANTDTNAASVSVRSGSWQENNGNPGAGGSATFVVDTVAPTVPVVDQDAAAQTTLTVNAAHGVLAGATDPAASEPLSVSAVNGLSTSVGHPVATAYGTLTLNADGSYSYAATASASSLPNGAALDNVAFTVSDSHGNAVTSTLSVLVYNSNDTLYVGTAGGNISAGNANSVIDGRGGNEMISVGNGADAIFGGSGDTIMAGNGNDTIGGAANNLIVAGNGNDTVTGGANDQIFVGSGQDQLVAGFNDTWSIGTGKDTIAFNASGFGNNSISGFNPSQDVLTFNSSLFQNYAAVHAATTQVGANAVISDTHGDQVTLVGVNASQLTANSVKIN